MREFDFFVCRYCVGACPRAVRRWGFDAGPSLRYGYPAVLALRLRCPTPAAHCVRCGRTPAASQITKRAKCARQPQDCVPRLRIGAPTPHRPRACERRGFSVRRIPTPAPPGALQALTQAHDTKPWRMNAMGRAKPQFNPMRSNANAYQICAKASTPRMTPMLATPNMPHSSHLRRVSKAIAARAMETCSAVVACAQR